MKLKHLDKSNWFKRLLCRIFRGKDDHATIGGPWCTYCGARSDRDVSYGEDETDKE